MYLKIIILCLLPVMCCGCESLHKFLNPPPPKKTVPEPQLADEYNSSLQKKKYSKYDNDDLNEKERAYFRAFDSSYNKTEQAYIDRYKEKVKKERGKNQMSLRKLFKPKEGEK